MSPISTPFIAAFAGYFLTRGFQWCGKKIARIALIESIALPLLGTCGGALLELSTEYLGISGLKRSFFIIGSSLASINFAHSIVYNQHSMMATVMGIECATVGTFLFNIRIAPAMAFTGTLMMYSPNAEYFDPEHQLTS